MIAEAPRILIADDEAVNRRLLHALFRSEGFDVVLCDGGRAAIEEAVATPPSLLILDLRMPDMGGLDVLAVLRERSPQVPVIVLTAHGDVPAAVQATRLGAYDFLIRPIQNAQLMLAVRRAIERRAIESELATLRRDAQSGRALRRLQGLGPALQVIVERIRAVAASPLTVLVLGETGTGKEVVARALHQESDRRDRPFVALDCGAIPDTLLESELFGHERGAFSGATRRREGHLQMAQGGTLFLDEVGNFNLGTQAKLLRVIQERRLLPLGADHPISVDVRLIAATNQDLGEQVRRGLFRQDLYFRLAEFVLPLPPLRERREDILPLALRFLEEASLELHRPASTLSAAAAHTLAAHDWPGNVRELRNAIRQAALSAPGATVEVEHLGPLLGGPAPAAADGEPPPISLPGSLRAIASAASAAAERRAIQEALRLAGGNKAAAARLLKVDYKTLYLKLKRYGL